MICRLTYETHKENPMKLLSVVFPVLLLRSFVRSDVVNLDFPWAIAIANRHYGYALVDHVIKTLSVFLPACFETCQETLNCFSVNYADYQNGTFVCELNRSNKRRSPASYKRSVNEHIQYIENNQYCEGNVCTDREALEDGWFKFNQSMYKLILIKLTWAAAKTQCQSIGGNLASFQSETEKRFIEQSVHYYQFMWSTDLPKYKFFGGASKGPKDGRLSLTFNGVGQYATTPNVNFRTIDFTFAFWVYPKSNSASTMITSEKETFKQFKFHTDSTNAYFKFYDKNGVVISSELQLPKSDMPLNRWKHIAITWNRKNKVFKLYLNFALKVTSVPIQHNVDLYDTDPAPFEFGAEAGKKCFSGSLGDILLLPVDLSQEEIACMRENRLHFAWLGLNDKSKEGKFQWSDGSPVSYIPVKANKDENDCSILVKGDNFETRWPFRPCGDAYSFICKKK